MRDPNGRRGGGRRLTRREIVTGAGEPGADGPRAQPEDQRIAAKVRAEIRMAIGSMELVLEQFDDEDAPWSPVQLSLFQERATAVICDLEQMSSRAAEIIEENPEC